MFQFIHPKHRQNIINSIFKSLNWEELFSFEKVRVQMQDFKITLLIHIININL